MLIDDLFNQILIEPALNHPNSHLRIVSGFATASMAHRHLEQLAANDASASVELVVGMTGHLGIEKTQHRAFAELARYNAYGLNFNCRYVTQRRNPVHAKTYLWANETGPFLAFCGSANYTRTGFTGPQTEAVAVADPEIVSVFFNDCRASSVDCLDEDVVESVDLTETRHVDDQVSQDVVELPLVIERTGEVHKRSGLNWGQRPEHNRHPDQAYIPVPARHYDKFPEIGQHFTVLTDDDFPFVFVRAQERGKALHTPHNNAALGLYFRKRLGVKSGEFVTRQHLDDYGRKSVTFIRIDDETYLMDFRPNVGPEDSAESGQL